MKRLIIGLILFVLVVVAAMAFYPRAPSATTVNLTRYLWNARLHASGLEQSFVATQGMGKIVSSKLCDGGEFEIRLNDAVIDPADTPLDVPLLAVNKIALSKINVKDSCASLRITQSEDIKMHVLSRVHFNTNVNNFEKAREFYGALGFETLSGFPDTNTQAMARAIGIKTPTTYDGSKGDFAGGYLLHGELVGPQGFSGGVIDLIEFQIPKSVEAPYAALNHLGMAKAVMHTANLAADLIYLKSKGIELLAEPAQRKNGDQFAIFRDLDGTSYELRQTLATKTDESGSPSTYISSLGAVSINVSDFKRSSAWYQMLGFEITSTLEEKPTIEVAKALGFDQPIEVTGAVVTHQQDGSTLELTQWLSPWNPEPPYPLPVNHLGIHRMAFSTSDIEADVATLKAQGVEMVSPITPCCSGDDSSGAIVAFLDPDGTVMELVEQPMMTPLLNLTLRIGALTD